MRCKWASH